ncbi:MAG TPA: threonine ammonia-lyase [Stellaceae bacterium]|jgi:threonine dehydratase|nr:threonine ammonia-lyase [Stellaceae bacterium]
MSVTIADIRKAAAAIAGAVAHTPTAPAATLSALAGCNVWLKLETLQATGSFKERGALTKLLSLSEAERKAGVVAMSAGNHAQGVAYHARRLGIPATIVMPEGTPFTKIDRTEILGATVMLQGDSLAAARKAADSLAETRGYALVHPYDDELIVAGQGTIALEMLADVPALDTLIVPVGGGGLIAGIATAAKAVKPGIEIVGVQAALYPAMQRLRAPSNAPLEGGATLAEGIAVMEPGQITREIVAANVADIVLVDEAAIEEAVRLLVERAGVVAEGAGAVGVAALFAHPDRFRGRRVGIVVSGGNIDPRMLASILMRGLVRDGCLVRLRSELPDMPGVLARVSGIIGAHGGNIVEVHHQRLFHDTSVKRAELDVVVETQNRRHVDTLIAALIAGGFPTVLLPGAGGMAAETT